MTYSRTGLSLTAALTLTVSIPAPLWSQGGPGLVGSISVDQSLEYEDNPSFTSDGSEDEFRSRTALGFSIDSETRTEMLRAFVGVDLLGTIGGDDDDGFERDNERGTLNYGRIGANSSLDLSAQYRYGDIDDFVLDDFDFDGDFDPDILIFDGGRREAWEVGVGYEFGIEGPFGLSLDASLNNVDYTGTADPDLQDKETVRVAALARFQITPSMTARALAGFRESDGLEFFPAEPGSVFGPILPTVRRTEYFGAGIGAETARGLSFSADVIFDRSETVIDGELAEEEDGIGFDLAITQELAAGGIGLSASSRIDDSGRRTTAVVRRSYDLPDGGLSFSIGLIDQEDDNSIRLLSSVDYLKEMPRSEFTVSLSQTPVSEDGDAILNTQVLVEYSQEINSVSSWAADIEYRATNELGGDDDDGAAASATISYSRELTENWGMSAGLEHEWRDENDRSSRSSNTVFFNIGRDITFGF